MNEIYTDAILTLAASLPPYQPLPAPVRSGKAVSAICGSKIDIELHLDAAGRITAFTQQVKACLIGQASAALMQQHIKGLAPETINQAARDIDNMLHGGPVPTDAPWQSYECFKPVRAYPARFSSVLLVFEAINNAITQQPPAG